MSTWDYRRECRQDRYDLLIAGNSRRNRIDQRISVDIESQDRSLHNAQVVDTTGNIKLEVEQIGRCGRASRQQNNLHASPVVGPGNIFQIAARINDISARDRFVGQLELKRVGDTAPIAVKVTVW